MLRWSRLQRRISSLLSCEPRRSINCPYANAALSRRGRRGLRLERDLHLLQARGGDVRIRADPCHISGSAACRAWLGQQQRSCGEGIEVAYPPRRAHRRRRTRYRSIRRRHGCFRSASCMSKRASYQGGGCSLNRSVLNFTPGSSLARNASNDSGQIVKKPKVFQ